MRALGIFLISILFFPITFALSKPSSNLPLQVSFQIINPPVPLIANRQAFLVYEILLSNIGHKSVRLKKISVFNDKNSIPFASFDVKDLKNMLANADDSENNIKLNTGTTRVLFMWLPFRGVATIPESIHHELQFETDDSPVENQILNSKVIFIENMPAIIVDAPLKGDHWVAVNGPSNSSIHRRTYLINDGVIYFAQRYAIDFVKIGSNGQTYRGDKTKNENYYCYNENIHAVADGRVVAVRNDIPQNIPGNTRAVKMTEKTVGGNYVVVDIGYHLFAFYAHMQPGSLRVKVGDIVKKGGIIGKIGNTGNSTEPHLHFHIVKDPSFVFSNSVPYGFEQFEVKHAERMSGDDLKFKVKSEQWMKCKNELLLENDFIRFPS